jgi:hypothetical protein
MNVKGQMVIYSRNKQLKSLSYYETDNQSLPKYLSKIIRIEKDRGFHNAKPNGKLFDYWLKVEHPILKFKRGCYATGLLKTQRDNHFNGDFLVNGRRILLKIEISINQELIAITMY